MCHILFFSFFFFNDTATTEIYTLSLHDALPIFSSGTCSFFAVASMIRILAWCGISQSIAAVVSPLAASASCATSRSEEHTSELQSRLHLVCRLLLEKKKKTKERTPTDTFTVTHN